MNYPVWELTTFGSGFLIALIAAADNDLFVQLVKPGNSPQRMTSGVTLSYQSDQTFAGTASTASARQYPGT